jgi:hypothetical protein
MSLIKTLNKRGSRIDPWGTPLWMSAQLLSTLLTLICCFLFDKQDFKRETEGDDIPYADNLSTICHEVGSQTPSRDPSIL